jgi:hypothetical protein
VRVVEFGEAKGRLAELAVLLVGVRKPLHQAVLVDELDAATALAGVEERLRSGSLAAAYPARVALGRRLIVCFSRVELRIVHNVRRGRGVCGRHVVMMAWDRKRVARGKAVEADVLFKSTSMTDRPKLVGSRRLFLR